MSQKPSVGRIVLTRVDAAMNNGSDVAPAVITHVNSEQSINIRVLLDAFTMPLSMTSVRLVDEPADDVTHVAWWPPRS